MREEVAQNISQFTVAYMDGAVEVSKLDIAIREAKESLETAKREESNVSSEDYREWIANLYEFNDSVEEAAGLHYELQKKIERMKQSLSSLTEYLDSGVYLGNGDYYITLAFIENCEQELTLILEERGVNLSYQHFRNQSGLSVGVLRGVSTALEMEKVWEGVRSALHEGLHVESECFTDKDIEQWIGGVSRYVIPGGEMHDWDLRTVTHFFYRIREVLLELSQGIESENLSFTESQADCIHRFLDELKEVSESALQLQRKAIEIDTQNFRLGTFSKSELRDRLQSLSYNPGARLFGFYDDADEYFDIFIGNETSYLRTEKDGYWRMASPICLALQLMDALSLSSNTKVYDIGTHTGRFGIALASLTDAKIHLVEIDKELSELGAETAEKLGLDNTVHFNSDAFNVDISDADIVYLCNPFEPQELAVQFLEQKVRPLMEGNKEVVLVSVCTNPEYLDAKWLEPIESLSVADNRFDEYRLRFFRLKDR